MAVRPMPISTESRTSVLPRVLTSSGGPFSIRRPGDPQAGRPLRYSKGLTSEGEEALCGRAVVKTAHEFQAAPESLSLNFPLCPKGTVLRAQPCHGDQLRRSTWMPRCVG